MILFVSDADLPAGHDWLAIRLPDGACAAFIRLSRATSQQVHAEARAALARLRRYVGSAT